MNAVTELDAEVGNWVARHDGIAAVLIAAIIDGLDEVQPEWTTEVPEVVSLVEREYTNLRMEGRRVEFGAFGGRLDALCLRLLRMMSVTIVRTRRLSHRDRSRRWLLWHRLRGVHRRWIYDRERRRYTAKLRRTTDPAQRSMDESWISMLDLLRESTGVMDLTRGDAAMRFRKSEWVPIRRSARLAVQFVATQLVLFVAVTFVINQAAMALVTSDKPFALIVALIAASCIDRLLARPLLQAKLQDGLLSSMRSMYGQWSKLRINLLLTQIGVAKYKALLREQAESL